MICSGCGERTDGLPVILLFADVDDAFCATALTRMRYTGLVCHAACLGDLAPGAIEQAIEDAERVAHDRER